MLQRSKSAERRISAVDGPVDHVGNALCVVHMSTGLGAERF